MADSEITSAVGGSTEFRIGNRVIDLFAIRLKDWPEASRHMFVFSFESLADLAYSNILESLNRFMEIAARVGDGVSAEILEPMGDITDKEYKILKSIVTQQNDIDMDRLMKRVSKMAGEPKNPEAPTSQLPKGWNF